MRVAHHELADAIGRAALDDRDAANGQDSPAGIVKRDGGSRIKDFVRSTGGIPPAPASVVCTAVDRVGAVRLERNLSRSTHANVDTRPGAFEIGFNGTALKMPLARRGVTHVGFDEKSSGAGSNDSSNNTNAIDTLLLIL